MAKAVEPDHVMAKAIVREVDRVTVKAMARGADRVMVKAMACGADHVTVKAMACGADHVTVKVLPSVDRATASRAVAWCNVRISCKAQFFLETRSLAAVSESERLNPFHHCQRKPKS